MLENGYQDSQENEQGSDNPFEIVEQEKTEESGNDLDPFKRDTTAVEESETPKNAEPESTENPFEPQGISSELKIRGELPSESGPQSGPSIPNDGQESSEASEVALTQQPETPIKKQDGFSISDIPPVAFIWLGVAALLLAAWYVYKLVKKARRPKRQRTKADTFQPVTGKLKQFSDDVETNESQENLNRPAEIGDSFELAASTKNSAEVGSFASSEVNFSEDEFDFSKDEFDPAYEAEGDVFETQAEEHSAAVAMDGDIGEEFSNASDDDNEFGDLEDSDASFDFSEEFEEETETAFASEEESYEPQSTLVSNLNSAEPNSEPEDLALDLSAAVVPLSAAVAEVSEASPPHGKGDDDEFDIFDGESKEASFEEAPDKLNESNEVNSAQKLHIESLTSEITQMKLEFVELKETQVVLTKERDDFAAMIDELKTDLSEVVKSEQELRRENEELKSSLEKATVEVVSQEDLDRTVVERDELAKTLDELTASVASREIESQEALGVVNGQLETLRQELSGLQAANEGLKRDLAAAKAESVDCEQVKAELVETLEVKRKLKAKLRSTLNKLEKLKKSN